nr:hypothetical protein [Tanacetum cinerariifolium]
MNVGIGWMAVKEIEDEILEEMKKFGWWFEQDIDGENEDGNEKKLVMVYSFEEVGVQVFNFIRKVLKDSKHWTRNRCFEKEKKSWNEMILYHLHQQFHPMDEMRMDSLELWKRS